MKKLLLLLLCVASCASPIRITETITTDSTGKTTKVIQKFYDTVVTHDEVYFYQQDYFNLMFRPYAYYDPFFYDPFWGNGWPYRPPGVVIPINPPRSPRKPRNEPKPWVSPRREPKVPPRYVDPRPGVGNNPRTGNNPGSGATPKRYVPRPLPPGPRGSYTPEPRSFSPPPAPRPVERGSSPIRQFNRPNIRQ